MANWNHEPSEESSEPGRGFPGLFRIGVDITLLSRIQTIAQKHGFRFFQKFLTTRELEYCFPTEIDAQGICQKAQKGAAYSIRSLQRAGGRFAAKEAVMKVLGKGWPEISWTDIEILPGENKRPRVFLGTGLVEYLKSQHIEFHDIQVSITHDGYLAVAVAVGFLRRPCSESQVQGFLPSGF